MEIYWRRSNEWRQAQAVERCEDIPQDMSQEVDAEYLRQLPERIRTLLCVDGEMLTVLSSIGRDGPQRYWDVVDMRLDADAIGDPATLTHMIDEAVVRAQAAWDERRVEMISRLAAYLSGGSDDVDGQYLTEHEQAQRTAERERRETATRLAREERARIDTQERLAAERDAAERAAILTSYRAAWVGAHGTASQRARLAEGLLPQEEAETAMRDMAYLPAQDIPRYERITRQDVCTCDDPDGRDCRLSCEVSDAEALTDEQYAQLVTLRGLLPAATITPRTHTCTTDECTETCTRYSLLARVVDGPYTWSREYSPS